VSTAKRTPSHRILKAARVYLGLEQTELAAAAGVSAATLGSLEAGNTTHRATKAAVQKAIEERGIVFTERVPGFTDESEGAE